MRRVSATGGGRRAVRSPPDKKRLSLARDCRNAYGENAKASRKAIPRFKAASNRRFRRRAAATLNLVASGAALDAAERLDAAARGLGRFRPGKVKVPDRPLGAHLARKWVRRRGMKLV